VINDELVPEWLMIALIFPLGISKQNRASQVRVRNNSGKRGRSQVQGQEEEKTRLKQI